MASGQNDTCYMGSTQIVLGVLGSSVFPTKIVTPTIAGGQFKVSAVGTSSLVQILPSTLPGLTVGGATNVLNGYAVGASETISWLGPAAFYVSSTGSTSTLSFLFEFSANGTSLL